ncbi:MAG: hypothetical protein ABJN65_16090 [Parasphingorhabdus sp.]
MGIEEDHQTTLWSGQIIVIGNDLIVRGTIVDLIKAAGGRITKPLPIEFNPSDIEKRLNPEAVVTHIGSWDIVTQKSISKIEQFCVQHDLPLLILLPIDLLNDTIAMVDFSNTEFLVTDEGDNLSAEILVTLNNKINETLSATFSNRDEPNLTDLRKISEDVERIARVLSQLTGKQIRGFDRDHIRSPLHEPKTASSVSDDPFGFKGQGDIDSTPFGSRPAGRHLNEIISASQIRDLIKARRLRAQYFDVELFADPAWDMLLDLMAARLENIKVSVSSLCIAASVPPTTALRWIKVMTEDNIFARKADDSDGRRIFIELSDNTAAAMEGYFAMVRRNNLTIV